MAKLTPEERFWTTVDLTEDDCWEWTGGHGRGGYGRFAIYMQAHRFAYEMLVGPIPDGLTLDHLCRNPGCVRPEHLEPVTARVNTLRSNNAAARNARKTHCPQGHEYTPENTQRERKTARSCRTCNRRRCREWQARNPEKVRALSKAYYERNADELRRKAREKSRERTARKRAERSKLK